MRLDKGEEIMSYYNTIRLLKGTAFLTTREYKNFEPGDTIWGTHYIIRKNNANGLKFDSMVLGETITQISKQRIKQKIGVVDNTADKDGIIGTYMANLTGKSRYGNPLWTKITQLFCKLVKEGQICAN